MDIPADILATLVCSKCKQLLKRGPVYQQHDGEAVCGLCQESEGAQPASRCLLYETMAQLLRVPCRYQEEGCPTTVPFLHGSTEFTHEDACEYRQYVCPVLGSNRCDWTGRRNQLLQHCQEEHPDRVLPNPAQITPDNRRSHMTDYIISAFNFLFLLHTRVCLSTAKLHYAVRLLDDPKEASTHDFTFTIQRGGDILTGIREVVPQELLALQEHSALNLELDISRGLDDPTFTATTIQINFKGDREGKEICSKCRILLKVKEYKDSDGWKCVDCAPTKDWCYRKDKGCLFHSFPGKVDKHAYFFCDYDTVCGICNKDVTGTLTQHYEKDHVMYANGTECKIYKKTRGDSHDYFLVSTDAGTAVCEYFWTKSNFELRVYTPVSNDDLSNFECEIKVTQYGIHTPDVSYLDVWDWAITVRKEDDDDRFWDHFWICVYIEKRE